MFWNNYNNHRFEIPSLVTASGTQSNHAHSPDFSYKSEWKLIWKNLGSGFFIGCFNDSAFLTIDRVCSKCHARYVQEEVIPFPVIEFIKKDPKIAKSLGLDK